MKKITSIITAAAVSALLVSCNQNKTADNVGQDSTNTEITEAKSIPVLKDERTSKIYSNYNELKDALVASDAKTSQTAAGKLAESLADVKGCENSSALAKSISNSSDLKKQRSDFTALSSDIIAYMKNADIASGTIYVQYCPMANEGKGGYWMASNSEIRNPYYGDDMLNCGEVKEELKKK